MGSGWWMEDWVGSSWERSLRKLGKWYGTGGMIYAVSVWIWPFNRFVWLRIGIDRECDIQVQVP